MLKLSRIVLVLLVAAAPSLAVTYTNIASFAQINNGGASTGIYCSASEGETVYNQLTGGVSGTPQFRINKVTNLNGVQATTELVTPAQWFGLTGKNTGITIYGFSVSGSYLQFTDTSTAAIWRVAKSDGTITPYVTNAQIKAFTGLASATVTGGNDTNPATGEFVFFESQSKSLLITDPAQPNKVRTLIDNATLTGLMGGTPSIVSMGVAADGSVFFGNVTAGKVWKRATDGSITELLDKPTVTAVSGATGIGFKDMFPAPDGLVYFNESSSQSIMRFNPSNPAGTLETYISQAELLAGPAAGTNVYTLTWYEGRLAFNNWATTGARGFYAVVPEPATLSLLVLGAFGMLRRRSR